MSLPFGVTDGTSLLENGYTMECLMKLAEDASPALERSLSAFGEQSIGEFLSNIPVIATQAYQNSDDLLTYVEGYVTRTLGSQTARRTIDDLRRHPMILTANHHGVDYFAQSVQGSLLFSLLKTAPEVGCTTVPIFACGNIPLNNLTYPRGALIYKVEAAVVDKCPLNLPIFSDKRKRAIVSAVEPIDDGMIKRCQKRVKSIQNEGLINPVIANTLESILHDIYASPDVLSENSYSDQSVIINHRLWKRLFSLNHSPTDLVYLELERMVTHLLTLDLCEPNSLAAMLILDDHHRELLIHKLDNTAGCWDQATLVQGLEKSNRSNQNRSGQGGGTHFFWGIDERGRRFSLCLAKSTDGAKKLVGLDDRGKVWSYRFNVSEIIKALIEGSIVPSLLTSYITVSFARGMTCIGGYYQSSYLPIMQQGVVDVLTQCGEAPIAEKVAAISTNGYLSGMQALTDEIDRQYLIPAGPVEIIASGGMTVEDLRAIANLNVQDAHMASLCDTVVDVLPQVARKDEWKTELFREMFQRLHHRSICTRYSIIH